MPDHEVTVVIPARLGSTRFPGKPLATLAGKPVIQHVYEGAARSDSISRVLVATDDRRIDAAVKKFGGDALLVDGAFRSGTDRVAAVARQLPGDLFINLQGDEILLHPGLLDDLIQPFVAASGNRIGTLMRRLTSAEALRDPGVVKVITDQQGEALYFSRAPIPHLRDRHGEVSELHCVHLGIYLLRRDTLLRFAELPSGRLEEAERLEQLRALEYGIPIHVWETTRPSLRIDTAEDLAAAAARLTNSAEGHREVHATTKP